MRNLSLSMLSLFILSPMAMPQTIPKPPPEHDALTQMQGKWQGEIAFGSLAGGLSGPANIEFAPILDGMFYQLTLRHELKPGIIKGLTLISWNPAAKRFRSHTFANGGLANPSEPRVELGTLKDGALTMASSGSGPSYRQVYRLRDKNTMEYRFEMETENGKVVEVARGRLMRAAASN